MHQPQANPTNQGTNKPPATSKRASERVSWSQSVNSPRFRASACLLAEQTNDLQLRTNTRTNSHCHSPQPRGGLSVCSSSLSLVGWLVGSLADRFIHFNRWWRILMGKLGKKNPASKQAKKGSNTATPKETLFHSLSLTRHVVSASADCGTAAE